MKKIFFFLFLFASVNSFSQTQEYLYKNDFDDPLINDPTGKHGDNSLTLKSGFLLDEQTNALSSWYVAQRIFIDYDKDYEIEMKVKPYGYNTMLGAEFGMIFGLRKVNMLHCLGVHTDGKVKVASTVMNQEIPYFPWKFVPEIMPTDKWYVLKIMQKDKVLHFYVNNVLVYKKKQFKMMERWFGWYTANKMGLQMDYFYVKQNRGAINIAKDTNDLTKELISGKINSEKNETTPMLSKDGKNLYFKRIYNDRSDFSYDDGDGVLFKCSLDTNGKAGTPSKIKNSMITYSWYISSVPDEKGFYAGEKDNFMAFYSSGIYFQNEVTGTLDKSKNVKFSGGTSVNIRHACISDDGKIMVLSGWDGDEYEPGGMDLFVSMKNGSTWSKPVKITSLNTKGDEITPFITKDMKHIYFSSDGHPGYGFSDVFVATRKDDSWLNWSTPENLGPKINDAAYNEAFVLPEKGNFAYMASSNKNLTDLDLFRVRVKKETTPVIKPVIKTTAKPIIKPKSDTLKDESGKKN